MIQDSKNSILFVLSFAIFMIHTKIVTFKNELRVRSNDEKFCEISEEQNSDAFFPWEAGRCCILNMDKLMRRGKILVNGCFFIQKGARVVYSCPSVMFFCV